jgi:hypothetical protein
MQYAGAPTTTTANNTRTAGGSIGRQGRVSVTKIFENDFI